MVSTQICTFHCFSSMVLRESLSLLLSPTAKRHSFLNTSMRVSLFCRCWERKKNNQSRGVSQLMFPAWCPDGTDQPVGTDMLPHYISRPWDRNDKRNGMPLAFPLGNALHWSLCFHSLDMKWGEAGQLHRTDPCHWEDRVSHPCSKPTPRFSFTCKWEV